MTPQAGLILDHLKRSGSITNVEANAVHRVRSVSRRITEIQRAGYGIVKVDRKDATGQRYRRYYFGEKRVKVVREEHDFQPVVITLESQAELDAMNDAGHKLSYIENCGVFSDPQAVRSFFTWLYIELPV